MSEHLSETSTVSTTNAKVIVWGLAAILIAFGALLVYGSLKQPSDTRSHKGVLVDATDSQGHRGRHNNTTIIVQNAEGETERHKVGSTLPLRRVTEIRERARAHRGQRVEYTTIDHPQGRLVSMRTVDGTIIVSAEHTLGAVRLGGWLAIFFGTILGLIGLLPSRSQRTA